MKRGRNDVLTGGSGDVNPQWFQIPTLALTAVDTFSQLQANLPIQRLSQARNKSLVMEVLRVEFVVPTIDANPAAAGSEVTSTAQLSTRGLTAIGESSAQVIARYKAGIRGAFTATGSYGASVSSPFTVDLTDGSGHGLLVGTDTIFFGADTSNFTAAATFNARLLYRWKEVDLTEYIGIVQSQTQGS